MVIASALCGSCAAEMLREAVNGLIAPSEIFAVLVIGGLHSVDVSRRDIQGQLRVFAVGSARAAHDRRCNVDLRSKQSRHASSPVLFCCLLSDLRCQLRIHGRCQRKRLDQSGNVRRIDGDHRRNTIIAALCHFLQRVGPLCVCSAAVGNSSGNAASSAFFQIDPGSVILCKRFGGKVTVPAAVSQDNGFLSALHLAYQILSALFAAQTPVFISVQRSVLVQILEGIAVVFNDLNAGS